MIVDTIKALINPTHFLKISLKTIKKHTAKNISRRGVKQDTKILKIKSEDPNRLSLESFKRQSYETIISALEPIVLTGDIAFVRNAGYEILKVMAEEMI